MMESPWESQRAEAENGELLSVEESDHEGERLVHKQPIENVQIREGRLKNMIDFTQWDMVVGAIGLLHDIVIFV